MKQIMPDKYREMTGEELAARILEVKKELGPELVVLAHHYQRQEIVDLGDEKGDSFILSKKAAENETARYIVFCGVHFMAESAAVLARPDQAVFIPAREAGCPMADMTTVEQAEKAWAELGAHADLSRVVPISYVNSDAPVKAFCGRNGGSTCTSSNADKIFEWALDRGDKIFFMPDEHLGRNSAAKLGIGEVELWDPALPGGGLSAEAAARARVIAWKGFCHVHTHFTLEQVKEKRAEYPGCKIVVHPECPKEVVESADASGSTSGIIKYVAGRPEGETIVVGTEIKLIERLARQYEGVKKVVPLSRSLCPNMFKINLHNLCWVLDCLAKGPEHWANQVTVTDDVKRDAAKALTRMLENG